MSTAEMLDALAERIDELLNKGLLLQGHELLQVQFVARKAAEELRAVTTAQVPAVTAEPTPAPSVDTLAGS